MLALKLQHYDRAEKSSSKEKTQRDELSIVEACKKGEIWALQVLYESHAPRIMVVCSRYLKNHEDAQDALQECFIKAFSSIKTFKGNAALNTWLTRIAINYCINLLKKRKIEFAWSDDLEVKTEESFSEKLLWEKLKTQKDHFQNVLKMMHELPTGYRTILNLYALEGFSHNEISKTLNISVGTSKSQLARARAKLCKMIANQEPNIDV